MAQELDMSVTKYFELKSKLVPKHLTGHDYHRHNDLMRKKILAESPLDVIQKAKRKYLRPIGEIETIMSHFDSKFNNKRVKTNCSELKPRSKRMKSQVNDGSASERELKSKMSYLLHLPTLGNIKKEAERYRCVLNADSIREREVRKARIMEQFGDYMNAELKGNPKPSIRRRTNTIE